jgi:hypothetical protein
LSSREEEVCDDKSVDDDNDDEMINILVILFPQPEETHNKVYKAQAVSLSVKAGGKEIISLRERLLCETTCCR